jgi:hypothetical protein
MMTKERRTRTGSRSEYVLDARLEQPCNLECEIQARVVFASLDCVDRLTRHAELVGQHTLRPLTFGAALPQVVAQISGTFG